MNIFKTEPVRLYSLVMLILVLVTQYIDLPVDDLIPEIAVIILGAEAARSKVTPVDQ